uniref:ANK_REP_REGION domain-containing protein n=1 Tax=Gongylonema pulchrum TaxID=637853 RepID=A0A183EC13_9BILA
LQSCIEKGVDVNEVDQNGTSALHLASFYGYHPIVHALIDARARVDARDREWFTPLQRACIHNHANTVKILINRVIVLFSCFFVYDAQTNIVHMFSFVSDRPDWGGCPPLHYATFNGNWDFVELLLKSNASPNVRNKQGMTAAHWAALSGHSEVLKLLAANGVDLRLRDQHIRTVLHYAALSGDMDTVNFVLEKTTIPIDSRCSVGYTPLHYAVFNGRSRVAET